MMVGGGCSDLFVAERPDDSTEQRVANTDRRPGGIVGLWTALGAGLGVTVGVLVGQLAMGIAIGAALGVVVGAVLSSRTR